MRHPRVAVLQQDMAALEPNTLTVTSIKRSTIPSLTVLVTLVADPE